MTTPAEQVEAITATALAALHQAHAADGPAIELDDDGILHGDRVLPYVASPKRQALAPGLEHIEGLTWHFTDTRGCGAANLQHRIASAGGRAASWHAVIDAAGQLAQSVPMTRGSWHAGGPTAALFVRGADGTWAALSAAQRGKMRGYSANSWAGGIELENVGEVRLVDGEWLGWPFARGTKWGEPEVVPGAEVEIEQARPGRGWHRFTAAQVETARAVTAALVARYGLRREACAWGHCEIDPQRRTDPGPLWLRPGGHLETILGEVFGAG
jgi:N-acetyl-anhydromuramyl-L-alanine amidase AmpD